MQLYNSNKKRDITLDGLKFIMIFLVTLGHAIEPTRYTMEESGMLYSAIYAFHMPMFIILSGYFSKSQNLQKINQQALKLLETYIVMDIIIGLLYERELIPILLRPSPSCWYILSLICWRYMLYWMVGVRMMSKKQIWICSVILAFLFLLIPLQSKYLNIFSIMRTVQYFPLFFLGYCISPIHIETIRNKAYIKVALYGTSVVAVICCCALTCRGLHVLELHRDSLYGLSSQFGWTWAESLLYLAGITAVGLTISMAMLSVRRLPKFFCDYGRYSLIFYFIQGVLVFKLTRLLPASFPVELLLAAFTIVVGVIISNYCPKITNPVSWLLGKRVKS